MNLETLATVILGVFLYDIFIKPFIRTVYKALSNYKWAELKMSSVTENPQHFFRGILVIGFLVALFAAGILLWFGLDKINYL